MYLQSCFCSGCHFIIYCTKYQHYSLNGHLKLETITEVHVRSGSFLLPGHSYSVGRAVSNVLTPLDLGTQQLCDTS